MKINEEWELDRDAYNIILIRYGVAKEGKKAGERVEREKYFYPTIEKACLACIDKSIDTENIHTILTSVIECKNAIVEVINYEHSKN